MPPRRHHGRILPRAGTVVNRNAARRFPSRPHRSVFHVPGFASQRRGGAGVRCSAPPAPAGPVPLERLRGLPRPRTLGMPPIRGLGRPRYSAPVHRGRSSSSSSSSSSSAVPRFRVPCSVFRSPLRPGPRRRPFPAPSGQRSAVSGQLPPTGYGPRAPASRSAIEHSALNIFHFAFGHWPAIPPAPPLPPLRADRAPTGSASPRLALSASSRRPSSRHSPRLAGQ